MKMILLIYKYENSYNSLKNLHQIKNYIIYLKTYIKKKNKHFLKKGYPSKFS